MSPLIKMDTRRYLPMETVLSCVNKHFIALPENDTKHSMKILKSLMQIIIDKMKETDDLFRLLYREIFHGGSYFEGLRIGQAKEYDLDLVLAIPKVAQTELTSGGVPGFVNLKLKNFQNLLKRPEFQAPIRKFDQLCDCDHLGDRYLKTEKVLGWTESVLDRALREFTVEGKCFLHYKKGKFEVTKTSSGPAITLKLKQVNPNRNRRDPFCMDIDLVSAFVFGQQQWPSGGFRTWSQFKQLALNSASTQLDKNSAQFFIVPKAPTGNIQSRERHWRLSFQKQERILMNSKQNLKPTIRLLKKMRDTLDQKAVASYYIKTTVFWIMEEKIQDERFWKKPLGYVFMTALNKYREFINNGNIPYYWSKNNNLLCNVNRETLTNFSNRLLNVINDIENNLDSPTLPKKIIRHLLNDNEKRKFDEIYQQSENVHTY